MLVIIVLVYIPVVIDAMVLHVVAPTLSTTLGASGNELPWVIDIYFLVTAGMVLPMGTPRDRIGLKRLLLLGGGLFGLASLATTFAHSANWLIATRAVLAIGAAMIVPVTPVGIRVTFSEQRHRNMAFGTWTAIGSGGAVFGLLVGGMLLGHFCWGSVSLINVPIVLVVIALTARLVPCQAGRRDQSLNFGHVIMLIVAIPLLIYSAKTTLKGHTATVAIVLTLLAGALLLWQFVRIQLAAARPTIDMCLFTHHIILSGVAMAMTAMITLVGFELLIAQELQFVHGSAPYQAGPFMLPVMPASGFSGPIVGMLVSCLGLCCAAMAGTALSAVSFYGLAMMDFSSQQIQAWILMTLLGFSAVSAPLASMVAIMVAVPVERAAAAGAIETTAYELGAGLGIVIPDLLLSRSLSASILSSAGLSAQKMECASSSMGEAV